MRGGFYRALCGELVHHEQHARIGAPTCQECARIEAEDEADIAFVLGLRQTPPENPVHSTLGDPLDGYTPRKASR
jgi:hypothetical protein